MSDVSPTAPSIPRGSESGTVPLRFLGEGGIGVVHLATCTDVGGADPVAMIGLQDPYSADTDCQVLLAAFARVLRGVEDVALHHTPHTARARTAGSREKLPIGLFMEVVTGGALVIDVRVAFGPYCWPPGACEW